MAEFRNPFLSGFFGSQDAQRRNELAQMSQLGGLFGIQNQMEQRQERQADAPLRRQLMEAQIGKLNKPQPKWQEVSRFNSQTGQKEIVLVDMNNPSNVLPMGGQESKPLHFANTGNRIQPMSSTTGQPVGQGTPIAVSPNTSATLGQQERHWSGLSMADAIRLGLATDQHQWETGRTPAPLPRGPVQGAPLLSPARPGQPPMMGPAEVNQFAPQASAVLNPALAATQQRVTQAEQQPGGGGMIPSSTVLAQGAPQTFVPPGTQMGTPSTNRPVIDAVPPRDRAKLIAEQPQAQTSATAVLQNLDRIDSVAGELSKHPGLTDITGKINEYSALDLFPQARAARGLAGTLTKQVGIAALQAMRDASKTGGAVGQVTEKEWPILQQSIAALDEAQATGDYQTALTNLQNQIKTSKARVRQAYESTYGPLQYEAPKHVEQGRNPEQQDVRKRADEILGR